MASSRKKPAKKVAKKSAKPRKQKTAANDETCLQMHCKQWLDKSGIWDRLLIFHVANERNEVKPDRLPRGADIAKLCAKCHDRTPGR